MFIFALKSAIVLSLLYLPYLFMLHRESFFRFNRAVLCGILLCSLALPLCNLPMLSLDNNPVVNAAQRQMIEIGIPIAQVEVDTPIAQVEVDTPIAEVTNQEAEATEKPYQVSWFAIVAILYIIVAIILLVLRLHDYIRLLRIIVTDCVWKRPSEGGITIYCHRNDIPAFSWYKSIVLNEADYNLNGTCMIRHETGHILSGHSYDIMLLTLVQLVQWFNPLVWLLGQSLQDVHEYEADDYVLQSGITLDEYRYLLIQKAAGASPYAFANKFNHSLLKKRITMMCKKKSSPWHRAKALYIIPMALLALSAFATPEFKTVSEDIEKHVVYSDQGKDSVDVIKNNYPDDKDDSIYETCEEQPTSPDGEVAKVTPTTSLSAQNANELIEKYRAIPNATIHNLSGEKLQEYMKSAVAEEDYDILKGIKKVDLLAVETTADQREAILADLNTLDGFFLMEDVDLSLNQKEEQPYIVSFEEEIKVNIFTKGVSENVPEMMMHFNFFDKTVLVHITGQMKRAEAANIVHLMTIVR